VVSGTGLRAWWKRFDAFGRKFIVHASPVLGSGDKELEILSDIERQRVERSAEKDG